MHWNGFGTFEKIGKYYPLIKIWGENMLYFYKYKDKYLFSFEKYHTLERIHEYDAKNSIDKLYFF